MRRFFGRWLPVGPQHSCGARMFWHPVHGWLCVYDRRWG